jgi:dihydropteroate synthase
MTKLVGILNLTPDSFSDGGRLPDARAQVAALETLIGQGADVVDIGAESTRPGATPLTADEEWQRLSPFFAALTPSHIAHPLSLDTRHAINAKRALDKGFAWINDVSGFADPAMVAAVAGYDCKKVVMHSLTVPASKDVTLPEGADAVALLISWVRDVSSRLMGDIIIDPGLGFGKTRAQNWHIVEHIGVLQSLGLPVLIGHSRKSFLGGERDEATLALSRKLIQKRVDYLRVHDVPAHRALLRDSHGPD